VPSAGRTAPGIGERKEYENNRDENEDENHFEVIDAAGFQHSGAWKA
jgi:hypothetical protein